MLTLYYVSATFVQSWRIQRACNKIAEQLSQSSSIAFYALQAGNDDGFGKNPFFPYSPKQQLIPLSLHVCVCIYTGVQIQHLPAPSCAVIAMRPRSRIYCGCMATNVVAVCARCKMSKLRHGSVSPRLQDCFRSPMPPTLQRQQQQHQRKRSRSLG